MKRANKIFVGMKLLSDPPLNCAYTTLGITWDYNGYHLHTNESKNFVLKRRKSVIPDNITCLAANALHTLRSLYILLFFSGGVCTARLKYLMTNGEV